MKFCIVVARYNENVEWTKQFKNVIICNKGEILNDFPNQIMMENVGREGHTYYKYICDNYDQLSDYIVFLQGNPFDHTPNICNILEYILTNEEYNEDFKFLSSNVYKCNLTGCIRHPDIPLVNVYEKVFGHRREKLAFEFGAGAQFIVSKKVIHKKRKEFYEKIVSILDKDINPIEGFVIERFHKLIFDAQKY
jgi:hypothetical protein